MGRICEPKDLNEAYRRVSANRGSPGDDGMTVSKPRAWLVAHREEYIASLLDGSYRPQGVYGALRSRSRAVGCGSWAFRR